MAVFLWVGRQHPARFSLAPSPKLGSMPTHDKFFGQVRSKTLGDHLEFMGKIVNGRGHHAELGIPGRILLPNAPEGWPEMLCPGSLNVLVNRYPQEFRARGLPDSVRTLDSGGFRPAFAIPPRLMSNNKLIPTSDAPSRGTAQVWRATITANGITAQSWVLRRIGSGLRDELELVSSEALRAVLGTDRTRDWPAEVTMWGQW